MDSEVSGERLEVSTGFKHCKQKKDETTWPLLSTGRQQRWCDALLDFFRRRLATRVRRQCKRACIPLVADLRTDVRSASFGRASRSSDGRRRGRLGGCDRPRQRKVEHAFLVDVRRTELARLERDDRAVPVLGRDDERLAIGRPAASRTEAAESAMPPKSERETERTRSSR